MAKLVLNDITNLNNEQTVTGTINNNSDAIVAALEKTLSRDGTSPNQMGADLDMNSHRIYNLPTPVTNTEPVRLIDLPTDENLQAFYDAILEAVQNGMGFQFRTKADAQAFIAPLSVTYFRIAGYTTTGDGGDGLYHRVSSLPTHSAYIQTTDLSYFELADAVIRPEQLGGDKNATAMAAYLMNRPMFLKSGIAYLDINIGTSSVDTGGYLANSPEARHAVLMNIAAWQGKCICSDKARIKIRLQDTGLLTVSAWDSQTTGTPVILRDGEGPVFDITTNAAPTEYLLSSITFGTRNVSDYTLIPAVVRGVNDYLLTAVVTTALPAYVVPGYSVGFRNVQGDNDAEIATGAMKIETISVDRLTITGTIHCARTANLVSPTSLITDATGVYQSMNASRLVVPSVCLAWDTSYTIGTNKPITAVTTTATKNITGITNASPAVVTSVAHGFANNTIVYILNTTGLLESDGGSGIDNRSFSVQNATADAFELYATDGVTPFNTVPMTAYVSGGTATAAIRVTAVAHGILNNDLVRVTGVVGQTQLNNRQYRAVGITTDTLSLQDLDSVVIDNSTYTAYASGGNVKKVTELWTGSSDEAYFNFIEGSRYYASNIGICYQGYPGNTMDQDMIFVRDPGTFAEFINVVAVGAGDKIFRGYGSGSSINITLSCAGGGGCQEILAVQAGCCAQVVRSNLGSVVRYSMISGDGCHIVATGCVMAAGSPIVQAQASATMNIGASKLTGGLRGVYAVGGRIDLSVAVIINLCSQPLDGIDGGTVSSNPSLGYKTVSGVLTVDATKNNAAAPALTANGVGGTTSNKGNASWIRDVAANQAYPVLFTPIDLDTSNATDTGSGVTINKPAGVVTSQSLTTAAGATATITVTDSLAETTSLFVLTRVGGTNTAGAPKIWISTRSAGSFVISITNEHATNALNGTLFISFILFKA